MMVPNDDHDEEKEGSSFSVKDKRVLHGAEERTQPPAASASEEASSSDPGASSEHNPITFASFILSLSTSVMVHLGLTEHPETGKKEEDINVAQQEIHIIEMLAEKTKGNLDEQEAKLMEDVLFHLRMQFLEKKKSVAK